MIAFLKPGSVIVSPARGCGPPKACTPAFFLKIFLVFVVGMRIICIFAYHF